MKTKLIFFITLFYNIVGSETDKLMDTLIYLKRAERQANNIQQIEQVNKNINLVLKKLDAQEVNQNFLHKLYQYNSLLSFFYLQVLFLILSILLICVLLRTIKINRIILIILIVVYFLTLISIWANYVFHFNNTAIFNKPNIILYSGPANDYHELNNINALAQHVKILDKKGDWFKIKYSDMIGWVPSDSLNLI